MPEENALAVGDLVYAEDPRTPGLYRITNRGPKNWTIHPVNNDGSPRPGAGARFPAYVLTPAKIPTNGEVGTPMPVGVPYAPQREVMWPGTVVRFAQDNGIYVVLADKAEKINIAQLGGNAGRYWRAPQSAVTVIPLDELAQELNAALAKLSKERR